MINSLPKATVANVIEQNQMSLAINKQNELKEEKANQTIGSVKKNKLYRRVRCLFGLSSSGTRPKTGAQSWERPLQGSCFDPGRGRRQRQPGPNIWLPEGGEKRVSGGKKKRLG